MTILEEQAQFEALKARQSWWPEGQLVSDMALRLAVMVEQLGASASPSDWAQVLLCSRSAAHSPAAVCRQTWLESPDCMPALLNVFAALSYNPWDLSNLLDNLSEKLCAKCTQAEPSLLTLVQIAKAAAQEENPDAAEEVVNRIPALAEMNAALGDTRLLETLEQSDWTISGKCFVRPLSPHSREAQLYELQGCCST